MNFGLHVNRPVFPAPSSASVDMWFGGTGVENSYNAGRFYPLVREATSSAITALPDTRAQDEMERPGTINTLAIIIDGAAGGPDGSLFVLYKDGVATAHSFQFGTGQTEVEIAVNDAFVEGTIYSVKCESYGTDAASGNAQFISTVTYS